MPTCSWYTGEYGVVDMSRNLGKIYPVTEEAEPAETAMGGDNAPAASGNSLYDEAVALVIREQKASTSFVQRHLKIGYNRAATLIEEMESAGVISAANHVGKRDVLISNDEH